MLARAGRSARRLAPAHALALALLLARASAPALAYLHAPARPLALLLARLRFLAPARAVVGAGLLALVSLLAPRDDAGAQALLDFITFDGIDYIRWVAEPGRPLAAADVGPQFAVVGCSIAEDRRGCEYGADAAAAFIPAGTRVHAVRGHPTGFRLAAVWKEHVFLYQAWRNPRARVGGALYAIGGKVTAIEVERGEPTGASPRAAARVTSAADAEALIDMIVRSPVRRPVPHAFGEPRYWLTLWLSDGTTLGRPYFVDTRELMGGVALPAEFTALVEKYLPALSPR